MNSHPEKTAAQQTGPVFLSGVYRSGTTFLTAVVNNIPAVAAASSTVKYLRFCYPHFRDPSQPEQLDEILRQTAQRIAVRWDLTLDPDAVRALLGDAPVTHARLYDAIMKTLLVDDKPGATRWAEKLAAQWRDIPLFLDLFPDGRAIHVIRDPRDVTASYKKMTYEPWPTFLDAALNCKGAMTDVPKLQKKYGTDRILILRAEDMAGDLAGSLKRICGFLGEPYSDELADPGNFPDIKGEDWRTNTSFENTGDNFTTAAPRWERFLEPEEIFLTEMICQPEMAAFGYPGSGIRSSQVPAEKLTGILGDPWFSERLSQYLTTGRPAQGYRTNPYETEMKIVFGTGSS